MRGSFASLFGIAAVTLATLTIPGEVQADAPAKVSLTVQARGFKNTKGQALFAIYESKDSWLKIDRAKQVIKASVTGGVMTATFTGLTPDSIYAVSVIHDENMNGKLDMHWFPVPGPDEGAGVSNDAEATIGPPSFGDCRVRVQGNGQIGLRIRY